MRRFIVPTLMAVVILVAGVGVVPRAIRTMHERRYCTSTWRSGHEARLQMIEFNRRAGDTGEPAPYGIVATGGAWSTRDEYLRHCLARQKELRTGLFGLWSKDSPD
jgi:hypothetical protein